MAILVTCSCGQQFQTKDENAGRRARCPDCGRELIVPKAGAEFDDIDAELSTVPAATSGKAVASLVFGLLSFFCSLLGTIPAVVLGILSLREIGRSQGRLKGEGLAIAGLATGAFGVVFSMVGVALLLPAVQAAREAARRSQCVTNCKQIGMALHNFDAANGRFPAAAITDKAGRPLLSWRVAILPYLGTPEATSLYARFKLDEPWDSPNNRPLAREMPTVYRCPSDPVVTTQGMTGYQVVVGPKTMFTGGEGVRLDEITDGTSNTIMVAETGPDVPWSAPDDPGFNPGGNLFGFKSMHPGGFHVLMADGSVRFVKKSISSAVLGALLTIAGGEIVSASAF